MEPDDDAAPRVRSGRTGDYRAARIGAAAALIAVLVVLLLADVVVDSYDVSPAIVFGLLGASGSLLGVELLNVVRGGWTK